jgi:hypothetical protein
MWPVRRLWKRARLAVSFLAFLLVVFVFSYGVFYVFDRQFVGGLLRQQNSRRRSGVLAQPAALRQHDLLPADMFLATVAGSEVKRGPVTETRKQLNYNVHIFYYGW